MGQNSQSRLLICIPVLLFTELLIGSVYSYSGDNALDDDPSTRLVLSVILSDFGLKSEVDKQPE